MSNPLSRFWSPERENEFQVFMAFDPAVRDWRNSFSRRYGEQPQIDGGDYDYRAAYMGGVRPQRVPNDSVPHWSSIGKAANHPTAWKETFMQRFGVDPDAVAEGQATPAMQDFMRQVLGGVR
jgi:hypothetical protein